MRLVCLSAFAVLSFLRCGNLDERAVAPLSRQLDREIPLLFGLNNNFPRPDSMLVQLSDPQGKTVFENKGYEPVWGLVEKASLKLSGRYNYHVRFYSDSATLREFSDHFDILGDEEKIDFSVNLSPFLTGRGAEVYLNKYYGNKFNLDLIRTWNPQEEFSRKDSIAPSYEIKNNFDSTIYGIYRVQSSWFLTHWARLHYSAYTQLSKQVNDKWMRLPTNTCVLEAKVEKGKNGKPYPDLIYKTAKTDLKGPGKFRIELEYGINDAIRRMPDSLSKTYPNLYYEVHIYRCTDEFELK